MPVPLDEYPVHQVPLSMRHVATSDRNAYDRCYFNAHDRTGEVFLVTGHGRVPEPRRHRRLRHGPARRRAVHGADLGRAGRRPHGPARRALPDRGASSPWSGCAWCATAPSTGSAFDLTWTGSFPTVEEPAHVMRQGGRDHPRRLALRPGGDVVGRARGRRRGARGERRPLGGHARPVLGHPPRRARPSRPGAPPRSPTRGSASGGSYVPLRFDDFAVVVIAQEDGDGQPHRSTRRSGSSPPRRVDRPSNSAGPRSRSATAPGPVTPSRRCSTCAPGAASRSPSRSTPSGSSASTAGPGYGGDPDWTHGQWRGPGLDRGRGRRHARPRRHRSDPLRGGRPRGPGDAATGPRAGACSSTAPSAATSPRASPGGNRWRPGRRRERRRSDAAPSPDGG